MISSKQIIAETGISRATLNNYISNGLLSKPEVINPGADGGGARQLGFFPKDTVERIRMIQTLKQQGLSMADIAAHLSSGAKAISAAVTPHQARDAVIPLLPPAGPLRLTVEDIKHPAYMLNYNMELVWFNGSARSDVFGGMEKAPAESENRNVLQLLLETNRGKRLDELLRFHISLAKGRMTSSRLSTLCQGAESADLALILQLYADTEAQDPRPVVSAPIAFSNGSTEGTRYTGYASFFREGVFVVLIPEGADLGTMQNFLAHRDAVIRDLLHRRLPVLTHLAILVADLQGSVQICSELPAEEYFELINQIWGAMEPIFRKYLGTRGKHVGDGMVYYFFPQPDSDYLMNALLCAQHIKLEMQKLSKAWQLRKNWLNELYLNTGITEGQEWLGTFQTHTSVEFVVLGDSINQAARISDFARHGAIWVSKSLIGKLPREARDTVHFGVRRMAPDGRELMVPSSYSTVSALADLTIQHKLRDIAALPITELIEVVEAERPNRPA